MNTFITKGDIPGLITYLANSDKVILEDEIEDESRNLRKKVLILDILKIKVPNRNISRFTLEKM